MVVCGGVAPSAGQTCGPEVKVRCECGRPAVCLTRRKGKSSRKARARGVLADRDHPLCPQCYRRQQDSLKGGRAAT